MNTSAYQKHESRAAFTLIELSIVLVIIGLLVGGIVAGSEMIKSAEIRRVISDTERFSTAFNVFKMKYNCMPGDCFTASRFITGAVDGNADEIISIGGIQYAEGPNVWSHLAATNLIAGTFPPLSNAGSMTRDSYYRGPMANSGYLVKRCGLTASSCITPWDALNFGMENVSFNLLTLGGFTTDNRSFKPLLTTIQNKEIDTKIDDGMPNTGVIGGGGLSSNCADSSNRNADYNNLNSSTANCVLAKRFP